MSTMRRRQTGMLFLRLVMASHYQCSQITNVNITTIASGFPFDHYAVQVSAFALQFFLYFPDESQAENFFLWNILLHFKRCLDVELDQILEPLRRRQTGNPLGESLGKAANAFDHEQA